MDWEWEGVAGGGRAWKGDWSGVRGRWGEDGLVLVVSWPLDFSSSILPVDDGISAVLIK